MSAENPNAFKHWFDEALVGRIATKMHGADSSFDSEAFIGEALDGLTDLELKDRVRHLCEVLHRFLPADYPAAIAQILAVLPPGKDTAEEVSDGFELWPYCHFVETYGADHFDVSMNAMYELTKRFSAEFAIRPFIKRYPDEVFAQLSVWTDDPNTHVRRWVSEGTRSRLPWGMRLNALVRDPSPVLPLLEALRHDPEEYVRRSVANNLNDIAKDHPDLVVDIAERWWADANPDEQRMIKHALRTLIKQGHSRALALLGFGPPELSVARFAVTTPTIRLGDTLELEVELVSRSDDDQNLLIDYAVHHVKANGSRTPKVFKWTKRVLGSSETVTLTKKHSMKPVTTRRYYTGEHLVELLVNGESLGIQPFEFTLPD